VSLDASVSAVAFDAQGKIIGVSDTPSDISIKGDGHVGVSVDLNPISQPASVKLYPAFTGSYYEVAVSEPPELVQVSSSGFSTDQSGYVDNVGFEIVNTSPTSPRSEIEYTVTGYDTQGYAVGFLFGSIEWLFPGEKTGIVGKLEMEDHTQLARIEIQVLSSSGSSDPMSFLRSGLTSNPLTTTQCNRIAADTVTCMMVNSSKVAFSQLDVTVLTYDSSERIIGGGEEEVSGVTAGGKAAVDVSSLPTDTASYDVFVQLGPLSNPPSLFPSSATATALATVPPTAPTNTPGNMFYPTPINNGSPVAACASTDILTVQNDTGDSVGLELQGPANYQVTLPTGTSQLVLCSGSYFYTASGCGGSIINGTMNTGETHDLTCTP
jgi:hypothetical protein